MLYRSFVRKKTNLTWMTSVVFLRSRVLRGVVGDMTSGNGQLSYEEVRKLLEFDDADIENMTDEGVY